MSEQDIDASYTESHRIKTGSGKVYVNVTFGPNGKPVEVFVNVGKSGGYTNTFCEAIGKLATRALQNGDDPMKTADALTGIRTDKWAVDNGDNIKSVPDAVGIAMKRSIKGTPGEPIRGDALDTQSDSEERERGAEPFMFETNGEGDAP